MFAHGANSLVLALFFSSLNFSDFYIGLFMTLTLLGDVLLSIFLTLVADRVGRRRTLFAGAFLMVFSGAVFATFENYWILLTAAVVGVISTTGGDFGPFRAIEESTISHLTTDKTRSDVLAWYVTLSSLGSAAGTEFSGRAIDFLQSLDEWTIKDAYHAVFWLYTAMGMLNMSLTLLMSEKCDIAANPKELETSERLIDQRQQGYDDVEDEDEDDKLEIHQKKNLFASISTETRFIMYKLWFLLSIDSLADGMVSMSLTYYYIDQKFSLSKSTLGDISSTSYIIASCCTIFAGPLARHLGLINTMVFTHLPSSLAVLLFPIPRGVALTVALFFIRKGLNNMDQAPRSAFIAAVVKPEERTAVMGITSTLRTLVSAIGPSVTGLLAGNDTFWIAFVAAGSLRTCYDLGLYAMFLNVMPKSLQSKEQISDLRRINDEEEELTELEPIARD